MTSTPAIGARGLSKRYAGLLAVDGLDLEIPAGQFFGLLGPNGSGKTTTIHMLSTLLRPTAGNAAVAGHDVGREPVAVRASIGVVFQDSALDRTLSIAENLRFAGLLYGLSAAVIKERSSELLELFGLADRRRRPVGSLSGGERRALDIVRGMMHRPGILFLDEPTIGLDVPNRRRIWRFIERLRAQTGMTVLLTTHYLEEADSCDQVAFIRKGRIVERGSPRQLVDQLGRHILEVKGSPLEAVVSALTPQFGTALCEGDVAMFRYGDENVSALARLQMESRGLISALRWRRPNLNDVFLWVNAPQVPALSFDPPGAGTRAGRRRRRERAVIIVRPVYAVIEREILRTLRQRTRLLASIVRPLIWLFVIGAGFGAALGTGGLDYQRYLVPGVLGMTLLFGAMLAALSLVYDKESGVMRMLIVAPLAHSWIVFAKMLSATLAAILQALLLLVVLALLGFLEPQTRWLLLALALVVAALACAGIGVLTAAFSRTLENFAAVMNFVIFPVFFLSGALYAVDTLPDPLKLVALLNPFTYAVDLLKHALLVPPGALKAAELSIARDLLHALGFSVLALAVASWRFSQEGRYEPLIHVLAGKRSGT